MRLSAALLRIFLCGLLLAPAGVFGQEHPTARDAVREGLRLAREGETAEALARISLAIELEPGFADAHFQKGLIHMGQASTRSRDFSERVLAQTSLRNAVRLDPDNPLYLLELGKLLLMQQIRVDAARVFQRALEAGNRADPATLAEVHYQLALFREVQWIRLKERHRLPWDIEELDATLAFQDARYVWDILDNTMHPHDQGQAERDQMLYHLHRALEVQPGHPGASSRLLAYYYDEEMIDEFIIRARQFVRAAATEPAAYMALGLGLHQLGRDDEASGAFQFGIDLMPEQDREDFRAVSRLMTTKDAAAFDDLPAESRAEAERRFWASSDPLLLTPTNEYRVEYLARMAYADLRFGLPEYRTRGWQTDRGEIWVRYGPPARKASFPPNPNMSGDFEGMGRIATVWSYGLRGPVFVFRQNPGFRGASFANDFRWYAEDYRSAEPSRFTAPSLPALFPIPVQAVRFRGTNGEMDVEVHAAFPLDSLRQMIDLDEATLETGVFLIDNAGKEVRRIAGAEEVDLRAAEAGNVRSWRTGVPEGAPYVLAVELRDPLSWVAAAFRTRVPPARYPSGTPSVSDILLARTLEPRVEEPRVRSDFEIVAEPSLAFGPNDPIGLYFELYNLLPDSDQFASYELEIVVTVEELYREGALRQIFGGLADRWGVSRRGEETVQLRFAKEDMVLARDMIPEYLSIQMNEPPAGRYGLTLTVRDRNAAVDLVASSTFEILERR